MRRGFLGHLRHGGVPLAGYCRTVLFRNTYWQAAAVITSYVFSFLLAPLMLSRLGLEAFGIWAVTGALATYTGLLDFGVRRSVSRFVALFDAQGDREAIKETVGLSLIAVAVLGSLAYLAAILLAPLVTDLLGVLSVAQMRLVLLCSVTLIVTTAVREVLASVAVGLRQMKPPNVAVVCVNATNFVASVAVLLVSTELTDYALVNAAAGVLSIAYQLVALRFVWRGPVASLPPRRRVREILGYSVKTQLVTFSDMVNAQTDKIIIAAMAGPAAAGAYEVANRAVIAVRACGFLSASAMVPTATAAIVERGRRVIGRFYSHYTLRSASISIPIFVGTCISAPYLLVVWLGEAPPDSVVILLLLCGAQIGSVLSVIAQTLANSDGRPEIPAKAAVFAAALNVALTLALAPLFGLWGVLLGTLVALTIGSLMLLRSFHRQYGFRASTFTRAVWPPARLTLLLAMPYVVWWVVAGTTPTSRLDAVPGLLATLVPFALSYWLLASRLEYLPVPMRVQTLLRRVVTRIGPAPLRSDVSAGR
jgi:O-antigen/teichoic acid export membrane protein